MKKKPINNLVIVSDLHCGCRVGLCPNTKIPLDDGGYYTPSRLQKKMWSMWEEFWEVYVPKFCHNEPYSVVINGDSIDGVHHGSTTQISHNLGDQSNIANMILRPVKERCEGRLYMVRGTEVHVGKSGVDEESIAKSLGAIPDGEGRHARYELWAILGKGLVHIMHHIGTTGSTAYESSALMKELSEAYTEAGRWNNRPPDVVVRSHRHRCLKIEVPTDLGYGFSLTTPGWQLKTPFVYKIPGGRASTPQLGGVVIRQGDQDLYTRAKVWSMARPKQERI